MSRRRLALVALILAVVPLFAAPAAGAAAFGPEEERAYAIALEYWAPTAPLCSRVDRQVVTEEDLLGEVTEPPAAGMLILGAASQPRYPIAVCDLSILGGQSWDSLCPEMVHEVGHLTGRGHSADPADPMYPELQRGAIAACGPLPTPAIAAAPETTAAAPARAHHRRRHHRHRKFAVGRTIG